MNKYNWLIRRRDRALNAFHRAKAKLEKVMEQTQAEIDANAEEIVDLHCEISERGQEIAFLKDHHRQVQAQHSKVKALLE